MSHPVISISCLIISGETYFNGTDWDGDINHACLYTPMRGTAAVRLLGLESPDVTPELRYVIQDAGFNYDDGSDWVFHLSDAKTYDLEGARNRIGEIQVDGPPVP